MSGRYANIYKIDASSYPEDHGLDLRNKNDLVFYMNQINIEKNMEPIPRCLSLIINPILETKYKDFQAPKFAIVDSLDSDDKGFLVSLTKRCKYTYRFIYYTAYDPGDIRHEEIFIIKGSYKQAIFTVLKIMYSKGIFEDLIQRNKRFYFDNSDFEPSRNRFKFFTAVPYKVLKIVEPSIIPIKEIVKPTEVYTSMESEKLSVKKHRHRVFENTTQNRNIDYKSMDSDDDKESYKSIDSNDDKESYKSIDSNDDDKNSYKSRDCESNCDVSEFSDDYIYQDSDDDYIDQDLDEIFQLRVKQYLEMKEKWEVFKRIPDDETIKKIPFVYDDDYEGPCGNDDDVDFFFYETNIVRPATVYMTR